MTKSTTPAEASPPEHPLDRILARHAAKTEPGGYLFIPNIERIPTSTHLDPTVVLRRATAEELDELHAAVSFYLPSSGAGRPRSHPWEHRFVDAGNGLIRQEPLGADNHRYHLAAFVGNNDAVHNLIQASVLASGPEFLHGIQVFWGPLRGASAGPDLPTFADRVAFDNAGFDTVRPEDLGDLSSVYSQVTALPFDHALRKLMSEHAALRTLAKHTRLRLLGRFAILEGLLVHKPKASDPHDSITRQVRMKMTLLDRRFARPIPYETFGVSAKLETLWPKLYGLRSTIAHGNPPTFAKGSEFALLGSLENADRLMASAVRSVLRQALEEPTLLGDLRNC